jgi:hypothetical protein
MEHQRLIDKSIIPTEKTIFYLLNQNYPIWKEVHDYILSGEKIQVETKYFTKNYGWSRRFFKGSKTICYLFPENTAFSILIVFGQKEVERIEEIKNELKMSIYNIIMNTEHFHDGRWVWFQIIDNTDLSSIKKIIDIKTNKKNA